MNKELLLEMLDAASAVLAAAIDKEKKQHKQATKEIAKRYASEGVKFVSDAEFIERLRNS